MIITATTFVKLLLWHATHYYKNKQKAIGMSSNFWWTREIWIKRRYFFEEFNVLISIFKSTVELLLCRVFLRYLSLCKRFLIHSLNFRKYKQTLRNAKDLRALTWMRAMNQWKWINDQCLTSLRIKLNHAKKQLFSGTEIKWNHLWLTPFTTVKLRLYYKNQEKTAKSAIIGHIQNNW